METKKVVITGIGIVSSLGIGKDEFWKALVSGKSGIRNIEQFSTEGMPSHKAAWVGNFDPGIPPMLLRRLDRPTRMITKATALALVDSKLKINLPGENTINEILTEEIGLIVNTTFGPASTNEKYILSMIEGGPAGASPSLFTGTVTNGPAGFAATMFKLRGMSSVVVGASSVGYAYDLIRAGRANIILAGGFEEITETGYHVASELDFLAKSTSNTEENSYPYDVRRNGFVLGEGSIVLVLESAESARARGVDIYAEIASHTTYYDAKQDSKIPFRGLDSDILSAAMKNSLRMAKSIPSDIDGIIGLAMSSPEIDKSEATALFQVFGDHLERIPICAVKGALGETIGMSGVASVACGALAIRNNYFPSTINSNIIEKEMQCLHLDFNNIDGEINNVLCNTLELSGNDIVHILKRYNN